VTRGVTVKKPLCGARRKPRVEEGEDPEGEYFCRRAAGHGTSHLGTGKCAFHGGNAPSHLIRAEKDRKKLEIEAAAREVARLGLPVDVDPQEALLQEVHRSAGAVAYLQRIVSSLDDDNLTQEDSLPGGGSRTVPSVWLEMYDTERKLLVAASTAAIKCGVAERQVRIAERQGELIAGAVRTILQELGVLEHPLAAEVVRRELTKAGAQLYALPGGNIEDAVIVG
jgi:hypothetical protein